MSDHTRRFVRLFAIDEVNALHPGNPTGGAKPEVCTIAASMPCLSSGITYWATKVSFKALGTVPLGLGISAFVPGEKNVFWFLILVIGESYNVGAFAGLTRT